MAIVIISAVLAALISVNWVYFKVLRIAKDKNLVDNPDARKLQKVPVPVMGGIAIFLGLISGVLTGSAVNGILGGSVTPLLPVICAMVLMLYIGALDDIEGLTPISRLVIEILAILGIIFGSGSCIDNFHGLWGIYQISWWIAVPLTVFAGVGILNAMNMIDGVNGLSSGLCIVCSSLFGTLFIIAGDTSNAVLAFTLAASLLPFMVHNVFGLRSRMFIGDAGTMVMGLLMTWFVICVLRNDTPIAAFAAEHNIGLVAVCLAILAVPVFDTLRVMSVRILHKKSPFHPDKTHLHHVFIRVGVSHFITAHTEILIDLIIVGAAVIAICLGASPDLQLYIVIAVAFVLVCGTYAFIRHHANHHTKFMHKLSHFSVKTHLGRKSWWQKITQFLDAPEGDVIEESEHNEHLARKFEHSDPTNFKQRDRSLIMDYIKGKAEVHVTDIKAFSGADRLRVEPILFEFEQEGLIVVVSRSEWGAPLIVCTPSEY